MQSLEVGLGERRITNFAGVGISVGEELDISAVMGAYCLLGYMTCMDFVFSEPGLLSTMSDVYLKESVENNSDHNLSCMLHLSTVSMTRCAQ